MTLKELIKEPYGKVVCVDLDGTLCKGTYWGEGEHPPLNEKLAGILQYLDEKGSTIIVYTARPPHLFMETYKWLGSQGFSWPISMRGKPPASCYLDDKAVDINELL